MVISTEFSVNWRFRSRMLTRQVRPRGLAHATAMTTSLENSELVAGAGSDERDLPGRPAITASRAVWKNWLLPLSVFLATLLLIVLTSKDYGVTWDEPPYFHASDLHTAWTIDLLDNSRRGEWRKSLDDQVIRSAWHWNPYNVPHPPFSRIVSGFSKLLAQPALGKISGYRVGPALFFALLVTLIFVWMRRLFGGATGLFSALAVLTIPNLFGYAHFAVTDMPLAAMWFFTVYCFWKGLANWRWSIVLGIVWGLAVSTKFPALLAPVPLLLWAHWFHRNKYANNLIAMIFVAPIVMVATQPYLWHQPGLRVLEFLYEGVSRGYRPDTNFTVFYSNQILFSHQLPWYYPFYLIGVTTPEPLILLALVAAVALVTKRAHRETVVLFLGNAFFILLLGLMPGAVLHDSVRQMLSALPFIAALAGTGFHVLAAWAEVRLQNSPRLQMIQNRRAKLYGALFVLLALPPALDVYLSHPYQLSFYNRFIGGPRGAYERGLETTYFLEALTPAFLREMNAKLPANARINGSFANTVLAFYQKEGLLRQDFKIAGTDANDYLLLLNRRSALSSRERSLIDSASDPYISLRLAGVPLVSLFDLSRFRKRDG